VGNEHRVVKKRLVVTALVCLLSAAAPASADEPAIGRAVLVKPDGDALVIWDASPVVSTIVKNKLADADANLLLERDAIHVLAEMVPNLDKGAKRVTVRMFYSKTAEVSPVYGARVFSGLERYALLEVPGPDALSDRDGWETLNDKSAIPSWFTFKVVGALPAR
jgi:hypothetical protein